MKHLKQIIESNQHYLNNNPADVSRVASESNGESLPRVTSKSNEDSRPRVVGSNTTGHQSNVSTVKEGKSRSKGREDTVTAISGPAHNNKANKPTPTKQSTKQTTK